MDNATVFMPLLQVFTGVMLEPAEEYFREPIAGWIFASRRTILGGMRATQPTKHHSAYHRVFTSARCSIDWVGLIMLDLIDRLTEQSTCQRRDTLERLANWVLPRPFGVCLLPSPTPAVPVLQTVDGWEPTHNSPNALHYCCCRIDVGEHAA
jgi:hypothetical protein